jgi:hypothetical protein
MSELVQGLPQATTACGVVPNWRMDKALADRAARNIAENNAFLSINRVPYFGGAGAGPSGWQTPVVRPSNSPKQKQGRLQMSELVQGLPQATTACGVVPNWRMDKALAERTARNIAANNAFLSINRAPYFGGAGAGPSGWQTPVVLPLNRFQAGQHSSFQLALS